MSQERDFLGVMGVFDSAEGLSAAAERAREAGLHDVDAFLPLGDPDSVSALIPGVSGVRWAALVGGLTGVAAALLMTIWMSWNYPLVTGGKPITSYPPFLVIGFELMVLLGSISTIGAWLFFSRLPDLVPLSGYHPDFASDQFALLIRCSEGSPERSLADRVLRESNARDVREVQQRRYTPLESVV